MEDYRWTIRIGLGGLGFLALLAVFVAVTPDLGRGHRRRAAGGLGVDGHDNRPVHGGRDVPFDADGGSCGVWLRRRGRSGSQSVGTPSTA